MKKIFIVFLYIVLSLSDTYAHGDFIRHCEEIMQVLGFEYNTKLFSRNKDTKGNKSWTKIISSDMIDNTDFHRVLEKNIMDLKLQVQEGIGIYFTGHMMSLIRGRII